MERPLVLIGPSGAGKSSLALELSHRGVVEVVPTWTTRPRRPDEPLGCVNHRFVDPFTFAAAEQRGMFAGTLELFGHRYGLPLLVAGPHGRRPAVVVRAVALGELRRRYRELEVVQVEAPPERIRATLAARGTTTTEFRRRFACLDEEVLAGRVLADHVVVNDTTVADLADRVEALTAGEVVR
jgi:ribose 1,5-bisphosphokinase PhnN